MAPDSFRLSPDVVRGLRADMPVVAGDVVAAVISEVPDYADPFRGRMGKIIETAVQAALEGFLDLASSAAGIAAGSRVEEVFEAAYALGRGEARAGRTMDALASAYRVGARRAWREMSNSAVSGGMPADSVAQFAEMVFDYIDQLSDASVSGHADELASSGRVRQRRLERLTAKLLAGDPEDDLVAAAERADWEPPRTLTAVLVPEGQARTARTLLDGRTLQTGEDPPGLDARSDLTVLLVPDASGRARAALLRVLREGPAVIGPPRPWTEVRTSYDRALQAHLLGLSGEQALDTDLHLVELVLGSDPDALADLRTRVLKPLEGLSATSREKLTDTLRAWLLHHGRRDQIAEALFVHPQTVRYRMGQLRELYGDKLNDPRSVLELTVALG